jgi:hypothetical protein
MDYSIAEDRDEIDALLQEAYEPKIAANGRH